MTTVDFVAFPRTVTTGGSVRLFPIVTGNLTPIISYAWYWGWTSAVLDSTEATPIATNVGSELTDGTVALIVTDSAGSYTVSKAAYITVAAASTVPDIPTDGTYQKVSVFIYDDTYSMLVNRTPTAICKLYLLKPQIINVLDKSPTTTFQLLDVGDSTATEKLLIAEGKYVIVIQGKDIVFSGIIRRCTQDTQTGFSATIQLKLWNIECDSDLMRLAKTNIVSTALSADGTPITGSPGEIARLVLTPVAGGADWRGNIYNGDPVISYQLNSSTDVEDCGSQYDHLMTLLGLTNYDLITRMDYSAYTYTSFNGTTTVTISAGVPAYILMGDWIFFTTDHLPGTPETTNTQGCLAYGKVSSFVVGYTFEIATLYGAASIPLTTDTFICAKNPLVDFAPHLQTPSSVLTLNVNSNFFEYSDNDDKRKLSTKVVVKGKDINGKTISVSLVACHAYEEGRQFFKDCTYVSKLTEGYVYKNTFIKGYCDATVRTRLATTYPITLFEWTDNTPNPYNYLVVTGDVATNDPLDYTKFHTDDPISPWALYAGLPGGDVMPAELTEFGWYYITSWSYSGGRTYISLSATKGGTPLTFTGGTVGVPNPLHIIGHPCYADAVTNVLTLGGNWDGTSAPTDLTKFQVNDAVYVWVYDTSPVHVLPTPFVMTAWYYINSLSYNATTNKTSIKLSASLGGSPVDILTSSTNPMYITYPGSLVVDNSQGAYIKGERIVVVASVYPSPLTYTTYYISTDATANGAAPICLCSTTSTLPSASIEILTEGTTVRTYIYVPLLEHQSVSLYGWGYIIPDNSDVVLSGMGTAQTFKTVGTPIPKTEGNGLQFTYIILDSYPFRDYSGRGFLLNKRLYVNEDMGWT